MSTVQSPVIASAAILHLTDSWLPSRWPLTQDFHEQQMTLSIGFYMYRHMTCANLWQQILCTGELLQACVSHAILHLIQVVIGLLHVALR